MPRCIRCGDTAATDSLYCESCFEVAFQATMTSVTHVGASRPEFTPEPLSPWVKAALSRSGTLRGSLPAKELAR